MDNYRFLPNKMSKSPDYHARIFLERINEKWFYGYQVELVTQTVKCPLPYPQFHLACSQRGTITKNLAFVYALNEITKRVRVDWQELDDYTVSQALLEECRRLIIKTAEIMLVRQNDLLRKDQAHYNLAYFLPKQLLDLLGTEATATIAPKFNRNSKQATLF